MKRLGAGLVTLTTMVACGGGGSAGVSPDGGGDVTRSSTVDSTKVCGFFLAKDCPGAENTPGNLTKCADAYDLGATRGCGAYIEKGWSCLEKKGASALTCTQGDVYVTDPACEEAGMVMARCVTAVVDSGCYGGACAYSTDCPDGWSCNDAVGQCFQKARACIGLPCKYSSDCSSLAKCNEALGVCVPL